jgi:GT2 family glycosyltransferase
MGFKVVIPSAKAANLVACVRALLAAEPQLASTDIVVVDDGARAEAEAQLPPLTWVEGRKPFNFARNINLGLQAAAADAFLLNDDALLATPEGFSRLAARVAETPGIGLCSAAVRGIVGNPAQAPQPGELLRDEPEKLAFVCVFVPRHVQLTIGPLDERFTGYGFEDDDYCRRTRQAGLGLAIWDGCVVDHAGELAPTFRTRPDFAALLHHNQRLFQRKWASAAPPPAAVPIEPPLWDLRIELDRSALPAAGLDDPAFWYVGFHDAEGAEIWREDAARPELRRALAGERIVITRRFRSPRTPAAWTVWPTDRRGRWLEQVSGPIAAAETA